MRDVQKSKGVGRKFRIVYSLCKGIIPFRPKAPVLHTVVQLVSDPVDDPPFSPGPKVEEDRMMMMMVIGD